jgi:hypothetical protein
VCVDVFLMLLVASRCSKCCMYVRLNVVALSIKVG